MWYLAQEMGMPGTGGKVSARPTWFPCLGTKSLEKTGIEQACTTDYCHLRGSTAQFVALSLWYLEPALEVSASFAVCCLMTLNVPLSSLGLLATQGQCELLVKILIGFAPFLGV